MIVYLAAAWGRREEIRRIAEELRASGVEVRSRWLHEQEKPTHFGNEKFLRENALVDLSDVRSCDVLVRFADDLSGAVVPSQLATGSRMAEMGVALQAGKSVVVVGGKQCVFDYLPCVTHVKDVAELKRFLAPYEVN